MSFGSGLAIYFLIWSTMAFVVLPFGVRTPEETGEKLVPGQSESAPVVPHLGRKLLWNTALSALAFLAFYLNYSAGWVGLNDIVPGLRPS